MIRGLRRRDSHPERLGIVERLSFRKKTGRGPASPLPPRPPTMGGRGSNSGGTLGGRSSSLGSSGGLQIEERGKGDTLTKGGRQAQGETCFTTFIQAVLSAVTFHHTREYCIQVFKNCIQAGLINICHISPYSILGTWYFIILASKLLSSLSSLLSLYCHQSFPVASFLSVLNLN